MTSTIQGFASEEAAFEQLYPTLVTGLRRALYNYGHSRSRKLRLPDQEYRQMVEELADEALCKARREIDTYDPERSPLGYWIFLLGRRMLAGELDRWQRWCRCQELAETEGPELLERTGTTELRQVLVRDELGQAFRGLPQLQAQAPGLFYLAGLSLEEVGTVLGKSPEAVSSLLQRARKNARDRLKGEATRAVGRPRKERGETKS